MTDSPPEAVQARIAELERQLLELRGSDPAPQAALIVTALGDGRILQASDGFAELSGYRRDELLGRSTLELGLWCDSADRDRAL